MIANQFEANMPRGLWSDKNTIKKQKQRFKLFLIDVDGWFEVVVQQQQNQQHLSNDESAETLDETQVKKLKQNKNYLKITKWFLINY